MIYDQLAHPSGAVALLALIAVGGLGYLKLWIMRRDSSHPLHFQCGTFDHTKCCGEVAERKHSDGHLR